MSFAAWRVDNSGFYLLHGVRVVFCLLEAIS